MGSSLKCEKILQFFYELKDFATIKKIFLNFFIVPDYSIFHYYDIEMYSTHNEEKSFTERYIRTLNNKIYKYMTSILKNVYTDNLDNIVNKYSNTYHSAIKMKPIDAK